MNIAAFQSAISQKLNFQFQDIVGMDGQSQNWVEMLYRPQNLMGHPNTEHFFHSLSTQQKVDLDIQIFEQVPDVQESHPLHRVSVNLMPISLLSDAFKAKFIGLIDAGLIDPSRLCLEIVEIHSMPPLCSSSIDLLKYFREYGGLVALDDFGSGFAHWELLQMGLIDVIKVANQNLSYRNVSAGFTLGLSSFAHAMGINTVLEGVENHVDYEKGLKQGFKNFQGWYFNE